jgi:probable HAF family extracellular repeat protein
MVRVLITLVTVALFLDLLGAGQYWCLSHAAPSAELIASRQFRAIYDLQELDTGNADGTVVYHGGGMSDSGTVVGETMAGDAGAPSATEWIDGRRIPLPLTAGIASATALSINRRGEIAGYGSSGSGTTALLWCGGKPIELSPLHGFSSSIGNAISADGTVAGYSSDLAKTGQQWWAVRTHACLWRDGKTIDLGVPPGCVLSRAYAMNDRGQVVGWALTKSNKMRACLWENGVARDLGVWGDGTVSTADGINNSGQIACDSDDSRGGLHSLIWQGGQWTEMKMPPPYTWSKPKGINDYGEVLGDVPGGIYVWDATRGMRIVDPKDDCPCFLDRAVAIGNDGRIVCAGVSRTQNEVYDHRLFVLRPAKQ